MRLDTEARVTGCVHLVEDGEARTHKLQVGTSIIATLVKFETA